MSVADPHHPLPNTIKHLFTCAILLLLLIQSLIPSIIHADEIGPRTHRVPAECLKYVSAIEKFPWNTSIVVQILDKESHCDSTAVNWKDHHKGCNGSFNIAQVACIHYRKGQDRKDPILNIQIAYQVYLAAGEKFSPWATCSRVTDCS